MPTLSAAFGLSPAAWIWRPTLVRLSVHQTIGTSRKAAGTRMLRDPQKVGKRSTRGDCPDWSQNRNRRKTVTPEASRMIAVAATIWSARSVIDQKAWIRDVAAAATTPIS